MMDPGIVIDNAISSLAVVLSLGIIGWTVVAATRARRGKTVTGVPAPDMLLPVEQRLQRLEQTTEAIALEVERIAEGQRFVTKLLSDTEHQPPRLGAPR
jgi:hypothetical protein